MRIYLDSCSLQRPLDDQTQARIRVETEAVLAILAATQAGDIVLLNSEALEYEMGRIPDEQRRTEVAAVLALAKERLEITDDAEALAGILEGHGISPMDAVHLALASTAKVDFFATSDDRLLRKAKAVTSLGCKVISALALVSEALR
ncbi:MAG: type II toxin-antitoxin system VapC family toxin [Gammaproteobacteria bacterium]|nr:type II toxin-antitoxin system VapC family toxin [Gammaproteobacteria bacterium]